MPLTLFGTKPKSKKCCTCIFACK